MGIKANRKQGRRTKGATHAAANTARQKQSKFPRSEAGQESNTGCLAKKPPKLQQVAASKMAKRGAMAGEMLADGSTEGATMKDLTLFLRDEGRGVELEPPR